MSESTKYLLPEDRLPKAWYNLNADLPVPAPPPLHPGTGQPIGPDDLAPIFPMAVIGQEVTTEYDYLPAKLIIRQIVRPKYGRCGKPCCQGVSMAPLPPRLGP